MSDLYTWSTTAASNNSTPPDGFPENTATADTTFMPSNVNNCMREVMRAVKAGVPIWWPSVTAMRAITTNPGTDSRHVLLDTTSGVKARFYKWTDTKSGSNNSLTIVSPTGTLSAGAFELIGEVGTSPWLFQGSGSQIDYTLTTTPLGEAQFDKSMIQLTPTSFIDISVWGNYFEGAGEKHFLYNEADVNVKFAAFSSGEIGNQQSAFRFTQYGFSKSIALGTNSVAVMCRSGSQISTITNVTATSSQILTISYALHHLPNIIRVIDSVAAAATQTITSISMAGLQSSSPTQQTRILIRPFDDTHSILVVHGAGNGVAALGNIRLAGGANKTLDNANDVLVLSWDGTTGASYWRQIAFSDNGA